MLIQRTASSGFTLIELMIGLVLLGVLLTLGLPNVSTWMQNTQLRNAAESIQSGLQLARAEAVRRNTLVGFNMAGPASNWTVGVINPGQVIQSRTADEGTPDAVITTTDATIIFNGLGKATLPSTATIQVTNPTGGSCKADGGDMNCLNVTVSVGGQIKMCDPAVAIAGDSRAC